MAEPLILALDQGTTSSRAIVVDPTGRIVAVGGRGAARRSSRRRATSSTIPRRSGRPSSRPPSAVLAESRSARAAIAGDRDRPTSARRRSSGSGRRAARSPTRSSGRAGSRRRRCDALRAAGHEPLFRARTGLPLDAYFSGPKIAEILDREPGLRRARRARRARLRHGRHVPDLAADRRAGPRDRRLERQPDAPVRHPPAGLGRRAVRDRRRAAGDAARGPPVVGRLRRDRRRRSSAGRSRSPAAPATSRRRRSARRASRRARRRRPTAPARSCS